LPLPVTIVAENGDKLSQFRATIVVDFGDLCRQCGWG